MVVVEDVVDEVEVAIEKNTREFYTNNRDGKRSRTQTAQPAFLPNHIYTKLLTAKPKEIFVFAYCHRCKLNGHVPEYCKVLDKRGDDIKHSLHSIYHQLNKNKHKPSRTVNTVTQTPHSASPKRTPKRRKQPNKTPNNTNDNANNQTPSKQQHINLE